MEYKLVKGNQKNFEGLLNELPKGGVIVSFTCNNDASYFAALVQLSDAVIENAKEKKVALKAIKEKAEIVLQKEKQSKEAEEAKAKEIAGLEAKLASLK